MTIDKSTQKVLWVTGAITGVSILVYYLFLNSKRTIKKQEVQDTYLKKRTPEPTISKTVEVQKTKKETQKVQPQKHQIFPLQKGSTGKEVERLQIWLLRNHGWKGKVTHTFDEQTLLLVRKVFKKDTVNRTTYEKHEMGIPIHQQLQ